MRPGRPEGDHACRRRAGRGLPARQRNDSGAGASSNGLWYDGQHSQADWIADWQMLAARYAGDPTVIGADLHNEPYAGTWGGGGANDWAAAAEAAGNAIGAVNPNRLIFVEGVASYAGEDYWWGGNLMGVRDRPIELDVADKLVYSAHDHPNSVWQRPWFQGSDFPTNLDQMWGYIYKEGIAPSPSASSAPGSSSDLDAAFALADAQALVAYAANDPDVAMLSTWSVARDNGSTAGAGYASPTGSGLAQDPFAFASIFQQYDIL